MGQSFLHCCHHESPRVERSKFRPVRPPRTTDRCTMQLGIIADAYASLPAPKAVLDDTSPVDRLVCLGDTIGYNPWPRECLKRVRDPTDLARPLSGWHNVVVLGDAQIQDGCANRTDYRRHGHPSYPQYTSCVGTYRKFAGCFPPDYPQSRQRSLPVDQPPNTNTRKQNEDHRTERTRTRRTLSGRHQYGGDRELSVTPAFPATTDIEADEFTVVYTELEPNNEVGTHTESAEELFVLLEGTVELTIGDERDQLTAGSMALIPATEPHRIRSVGDQPVRFIGVFPDTDVTSEFESALQPMNRRTFRTGVEDSR